MSPSRLGLQIRAAREAAPNPERDSGRGLSVRRAAEVCGCAVSHYQRLEGGEVGAPEPSTLRRIAEGLQCSYVELLEAAGYS